LSTIDFLKKYLGIEVKPASLPTKKTRSLKEKVLRRRNPRRKATLMRRLEASKQNG
jgi:hypothetical protein